MPLDRPLSAVEYFDDLKKCAGLLMDKTLRDWKNLKYNTMQHLDYMEMMEDYADYICKYEKGCDAIKTNP